VHVFAKIESMEEINQSLPQIEPKTPSLKINKKPILHVFSGILLFLLLVSVGILTYRNHQLTIELQDKQQTLPKATAFPGAAPTLATPSLSTEPTQKQEEIEVIDYEPMSSWQTYTDSEANYSVQYPESFILGGSNLGRNAYFNSCLDDEKLGRICLTGFSIVVFDDYDGGSRRVWYEKEHPDFLIDPYYEEVIVDEVKTLIIMDGNSGGSTGSSVLIPKGNNMYEISFPSGWNPETGEKAGLEFFKQVLSTFKFLD